MQLSSPSAVELFCFLPLSLDCALLLPLAPHPPLFSTLCLVVSVSLIAALTVSALVMVNVPASV